MSRRKARRRSFILIDDGFPQHPAVMAAGPKASMLFLAAACWSASFRTDGHIPRVALRRLCAEADVVGAERLAERLLVAGLWSRSGEDYVMTARDLCRLPGSSKQRSALRRAWDAIAGRVRPVVLARDGYQCCACGATEGQLHVDHMVPIALGGGNELTNLQTLCRPCNLRKGANAWTG